uniref:von Willebrand factor-like n=1 Tax=Gasterosteus aculeatus aculeatus TaxID=481459 RepID=UPI001A99F8CA|nr:von Willebrand factor-like [Gasterosteus aculeatus aculeatus]
MVDLCTHCECIIEKGAVKKYTLSCRRIKCPTCTMGYTLQKEDDACCGRCVPTTCFMQRPDGKMITVQVNTTSEEGCSLYTCGVNGKGDLVLQTRVTSCPPFDRQICLDQGGKISRIGTTCCEMCKYIWCLCNTVLGNSRIFRLHFHGVGVGVGAMHTQLKLKGCYSENSTMMWSENSTQR